MTSDLESRIERLEADLANASNAAFQVTNNAISIRIALGAVVATLGPPTRQKALRNARREAARQFAVARRALELVAGPDDQAWRTQHENHEQVLADLDRIFADA